MLSSLLAQCAGEMFDFSEFCTTHTGIPVHGGVHFAAGQGQRDGAH